MSIYDSKRFIKEVLQHPENFYIVHYSCQSIYDDNEALSPRITSIAVTHYATEQTVSFSTHSIAEELYISREEVKNRFDEIELTFKKSFTLLLETGATDIGSTGICVTSRLALSISNIVFVFWVALMLR